MAKQAEEVKKPSINRILLEINKKAEENVIGRAGNMPTLAIERITTGVKKVDEIIGGGWPVRRIVELYGQPSAGKSLLSLLTIAEAQKQGKECVYLDIEDSLDKEWATKLGVDVNKLIVSQSYIGEDTFTLIAKILKAEPAVIVVDSVAGIVTQAEMDAEIGKQLMAPRARLLSKGLSILNALNKKTVLIFINQLRSTMSMYGPAFTTPGGQALKFYSSVRLEVKAIEKITEDGKKTSPIIGQVVGVKVAKNKTSAPFRDTSFKLYTDGRIEE